MDQAVARLERIADRLERVEASRLGSLPPASVSVPAPSPPEKIQQQTVCESKPAPSGWAELLNKHLPPLERSSKDLGAEIAQGFQTYKHAYQEVGKVIQISTISQQPDPEAMQSLLKPIAQNMMTLGSLTEGKRTASFNHLKVMSESVQALSWLAYTGPSCGMNPPADHVAATWGSAEFYANKILKEMRGVDDTHVEWVKLLKALMSDIENFLRVNFSGGLKWAGPQGLPLHQALLQHNGDFSTSEAKLAVKAPGVKAPPPPPPPGAPPPPLSVDKIQEKGKGISTGVQPSMAALFQDISKGEGVTSGLKKVTDDMKTKNRTDRSNVVKMPESTPSGSKTSSGKGPLGVPSGVPKLELQDRKWLVEYQVGNRKAVIEVSNSRQSVYIYGCKDTLVTVSGKVNNIAIDSCMKTGIIFSDVIASCEVVNSKGIQLQASGIVPTISVEKTDGCQIFLTKQIMDDSNFQIVTAKCSEINVVVMASGQEDPKEMPIPEQFITSFKNGELVTEAASHSGA